MEKVRIGVFGGFRGRTMADWCMKNGDSAEVVAICDASETALQSCREMLNENRREAAF